MDVRHRFPGLRDGWARLDGPAGTLPVDSCIEAMAGYLASTAPANLGGAFAASRETGEIVEDARLTVGRLLGATGDQIVFGPNATSLVFQLTRAVARDWQPGDRIVCTQLDHDANVRPWMLAAADRGVEVAFLPIDPRDGSLDVEPLTALCADGRVRWLAISGASNLTGHVPDLARAVAIAHAAGAKVLVDAVARVPHLPTDARAVGADALVTSPYKWYGPHAGVLVLSDELLATVEPYRVKPADYTGGRRWETGTPSFESVAGTAAAARFLLDDPVTAALDHEHVLLGHLERGLASIEAVTIHGATGVPPSGERAPTVVFTVAGHHPDAVAEHLASRHVAVWSGDNYACELVDALGLRAAGGLVRAGIVRYTSADDLDRLVDAMHGLAG